MSLNEPIVEDVALTWFGELDYAIGYGPHIVPGELEAERNSFGVMVCLCAAIQWLNSAMPEEGRATIRDFRIVENLTRREMKP